MSLLCVQRRTQYNILLLYDQFKCVLKYDNDDIIIIILYVGQSQCTIFNNTHIIIIII